MPVRSRLVSAALGSGVAAFLALPTLALACCGWGHCDCVEFLDDGLPLFEIAPANGSADVPTNTRIWVAGTLFERVSTGTDADGLPIFEELTAVTLVGDDDVEVPTTRSSVWSQSDWLEVMRPEAELQPNREYRLFVGGSQRVAFTTGQGRDDVAPEAPNVDGSATSRSAAPDDERVTFTVEFEHDSLLAVARRDPGFLPAEEAGDVFGALVTSQENVVWVFGNEDCSYQQAQPDDDVTVTVGVFDLAGNFSGWGSDAEIHVPGLGCSGAASLAAWPVRSAGWSTVLLLHVLWRRRRGRKSPFGPQRTTAGASSREVCAHPPRRRGVTAPERPIRSGKMSRN